MKYLVQSLAYIGKNIIYIIVFAIIPAFFLGIAFDYESVSVVIRGYFSGKTRDITFLALFNSLSIFKYNQLLYFLIGIFSFISLVIFVSFLTAFIEKHMRIGKRTLRGVFSKLNDNLISTFFMCLLFGFLYEIWALLTSALLYFVFHIQIKALVYVFSILIFFGLELAFLELIASLYLWLPCLQITGFHAFEALRYSNQLVDSVKWKIIIGQLVMLTLVQVLLSLSSVLLSNFGLSTIISMVVYIIVVLVFCVGMEVVYFDRAQIERADLKKFYYI